MALIRLGDGTWHLTAPDESWGGVRAHYLDEVLVAERDALTAAIATYDLAYAHYQPDQRRHVLVERRSVPT